MNLLRLATRRSPGAFSLIRQRYQSSLHSPMFPQRYVPEVVDPVKSSGQGSDAADFLSKHGGKVALGGFAAAFALIYTYVKSNELRTRLDRKVESLTTVDALEINDFRKVNQLKAETFDSIAESTIKQFPSGECTYLEFISFVKSKIGPMYPLQYGHILDRVMLSRKVDVDDSTGIDFTEAPFESEAVGPLSTNKLDLSATLFSVGHLLVALNLAICEPAPSRAQSLFKLAALLDEAGNKKPMTPSRLGSGDSLAVEGETEAEAEAVVVLVSKESTLDVISYLADTWQIPSGKRITETGDKYPLRTYRVKTPDDMLNGYADSAKSASPPRNIFTGEGLGREEFIKLLFSGQVCAWGQCYSRN